VSGPRVSSEVRPGGHLPAAEPDRSLRGRFLTAWHKNRDLLDSASSLAATTGVTSVLGFAYWAFAARLFSQRAVGYGSASVSAMTLLGTIGMLGLGTVLIGELPRRKPRAGLVSAALLTAGLGSLLLGLTFAIAAPHFSQHFRDMSSTSAQAALFAAGVMLTGVSLVFDQATIGLLRGGLQLSRNLAFAVVKLAILPAVAVALHDGLGVGITLSWVAGTALSMLLIALRLRLSGTPVLPRPDWRVLRGLGRTAVAHSWLNLAITVPRSLMPVLVTVIVSPSANAAFYAAWTLSGFLYIVPMHLATVLFAVASADPEKIARKLRFTLRLSVLIGVPGMVALGLGGHFALSLFGPSYARAATVPLMLLVIGYLPTIPKVHYIAVCRATGRIGRAAAVLTGAATLEVAAAAAGGAAGGMEGLTLALLAVFFLEGLVTAPPVFRAAVGYGRHRRSVTPAAASADPARSRQQRGQPLDHAERQGEGMAVLLSLARSAGVESPYSPPY
jgi:O-antigen/teichoic acid export membrane protein